MDGNLINLLGVAGLLIGHSVISLSDDYDRAGFVISGLGAVVVMLGSAMLSSWPVVFLNGIWALVSFLRASRYMAYLINRRNITVYASLALAATASAALSLIGLGEWPVSTSLFSALAYSGALVYLLSYALLATKRISKTVYLAACVGGYFLLVPHLTEIGSWAVLANETLGVALAALGLARLAKARFRMLRVDPIK